jgi:hypothetical protein
VQNAPNALFPLALKERNDPTQHKKQAQDQRGHEHPRLDRGSVIGVGKVMTAINAAYGIIIDPSVAIGAPVHITFNVRFLFVIFPPGIFFFHVFTSS